MKDKKWNKTCSTLNANSGLIEKCIANEFYFIVGRKLTLFLFLNNNLRLKKDLYNRLVDLASIFQVEVPHHMPRSIPRLLSENIAISNSLLTITESVNLAKQDCILRE